jgi:cytochrome c oxidase subunit 3
MSQLLHAAGGPLGGVSAAARRPVVPSAVLGALIFVAAEVMFFSGVMSAITISRAGTPPGMWPTAHGQLGIAAASADVATALVIASGVALLGAQRLLARQAASGKWLLLAAIALGAAFAALQARGWLHVAGHGTTAGPGRVVSFYLLLVGVHTAHAVGALGALGVAWVRLMRGAAARSRGGLFAAAQVFWYFVVVMWPILYGRLGL